MPICNTLKESHQKERDPKVVQVWDCTFDDDLKELIGTTYTNKMDLLFGSPSLKTPQLSVLGFEQLWDRWPSEKSPRKCAIEDKICWKVSCWFMRTIIDFESSQNKLLRSRKGYLRRVMTGGEFCQWGVEWRVVVLEPPRSKKSGALHNPYLDF